MSTEGDDTLPPVGGGRSPSGPISRGMLSGAAFLMAVSAIGPETRAARLGYRCRIK